MICNSVHVGYTWMGCDMQIKIGIHTPHRIPLLTDSYLLLGEESVRLLGKWLMVVGQNVPNILPATGEYRRLVI